MQTSIYLAKLMGPVIAVAGLGFLVNRPAVIAMAEDFVNSRSMIFMSGIFALIGGLAIVNAHNVWVADWPVIITIFGWLAIVGGIVRMTMPELTRSIASKMMGYTQFLTVEAILLIALGAWLSYVGYLA